MVLTKEELDQAVSLGVVSPQVADSYLQRSNVTGIIDPGFEQTITSALSTAPTPPASSNALPSTPDLKLSGNTGSVAIMPLSNTSPNSSENQLPSNHDFFNKLTSLPSRNLNLPISNVNTSVGGAGNLAPAPAPAPASTSASAGGTLGLSPSTPTSVVNPSETAGNLPPIVTGGMPKEPVAKIYIYNPVTGKRGSVPETDLDQALAAGWLVTGGKEKQTIGVSPAKPFSLADAPKNEDGTINLDKLGRHELGDPKIYSRLQNYNDAIRNNDLKEYSKVTKSLLEMQQGNVADENTQKADLINNFVVEQQEADDIMAQQRLQREKDKTAIFQEYQNANNELANTKIDPNRWWTSKSAGQQVTTGLLSILAGYYNGKATQGRTENPALKIIDNAIENDINAQKSNVEIKKAALTGKLNQYQILRQRGLDDQEASQILTQQKWNKVRQQGEALAAGSASKNASINAEYLKSEIDAKQKAADQKLQELAEARLINAYTPRGGAAKLSQGRMDAVGKLLMPISQLDDAINNARASLSNLPGPLTQKLNDIAFGRVGLDSLNEEQKQAWQDYTTVRNAYQLKIGGTTTTEQMDQRLLTQAQRDPKHFLDNLQKQNDSDRKSTYAIDPDAAAMYDTRRGGLNGKPSEPDDAKLPSSFQESK